MRQDFYRPAVMAKMTAGFDTSRKLIAWHVRLAGNSIQRTLFPHFMTGVDRHMQEGLLEDMPYDAPHYLCDYVMRNTHVPVGFMRCVNHSQNAFFKECFVDEMAYAACSDPYQFRRALLCDQAKASKLLAVLDAAAHKAQWETIPAAEAGVHRGIALHQVHDTPVAAVAEVSISTSGDIKIHRFIIAIDLGHAVNPMTIERQIAGAVAFGLTSALYGEITIKSGRVEQSNFNDYGMLRLADMPQVDSIILQSGGFFGGCGEPPVAVIAPALCNAIFAATGKRVRALPLKNFDLRKA
jgi:isoquinoline 1-oxidoreductase beta subunit